MPAGVGCSWPLRAKLDQFRPAVRSALKVLRIPRIGNPDVDSVYIIVDTVNMAAQDRGSGSASPRDHLVQVAVELVAKEGIESLSLRRIARRAGLSHSAPLRHFESLSDLLAEVAAHGYRLLSEAITRSVAESSTEHSALELLRGAGRAYVHVAVENPGLFALMFRPDSLRIENSQFQVDSKEAFEQLLGVVRAAQDVNWHAGRDTRLLAGVVWSSVHGLASLWSQGALLGPVPDASLEDALELSLEVMLSSQILKGEST